MDNDTWTGPEQVNDTWTGSGPGSLSISGFSFGISIVPTTIVFTGAQIDTVTPYIFVGNSLFGPNVDTTAGGQWLLASDLANTPAFVTVASGSTVGLGRVRFNVSNLAVPGLYAVSLVAAQSSLADYGDPANNISVDALDNGSITVLADVVVPEPGSSLLCFAGLAGLAAFRKRV